MTKYVYTFEMDDGRTIHIDSEEDPDITHILNDHLGQRCALARTGEIPDEPNSVMTGFMIKV